MGDSERRRAEENRRFRQTQDCGDELWNALEIAEEENLRNDRDFVYNEHVMRDKKNIADRHYKERKWKEEKG